MTPFWIINFLEKDSVESFFDTYWEAFVENTKTPDGPEPLKFFHVTDGQDNELTKDALKGIATQKLSMKDSDGTKLIPAFQDNENNSINVFFIGDITQSKTIERLHLWATYLKKEYQRNRWHAITRVKMYAILLRPVNSTIADDVLTLQVRGFLNELSSLEKLDINNRPFDQVLFIQAPLDKDGRQDAEFAASLAAYHIARTDGRCFNNPDVCFYDTGVSAVFYESNVQRGIDAYDLSVVMLNDFTKNNEQFFYNAEEARQYVDGCKTFINTLTPASMKKTFTSNRPDFPDISKIVKFDVFNEFDERQFDAIVKDFETKLKAFKDDYCNKLSENQIAFVRNSSLQMRETVFALFKPDRDSHRRIGLVQSLKILEFLRAAIKDAFNTEDKNPIKPFEISIDKSLPVSSDPNGILEKLKNKIKRFETFKKNLWLITGLISVLLAVGLTFLIPYWGGLFALLGPVIGGLILKAEKHRIEALKKQYIAVKIGKIEDILRKEIEKCVETTTTEINKYGKWLRDRKLRYLQECMSVLLPPKFKFKVSRIIQHLMSAEFTRTTNEQFLQAKDIDLQDFMGHLDKYGSFGSEPIVHHVPTVNIQTNEGDILDIAEIVNDHKDVVQSLVKELMERETELDSGVTEDIGFKKHEYSFYGGKMLLILDVSGSMYGSMDELKQYVENLSELGDIEWIAFADNVVATSEDTEAEDLVANGGTNYIPAIKKAEEWLEEKDFDSIILLSDGYPYENVCDIIEAAQKLLQPLNTISIGNRAETVLKEIANETGGDEITVDTISDINSKEKWDNTILPRLQKLRDGDYLFGELMKYTQIKDCAKLLYLFAIDKIERTSLTIPKMLADHLNPKGLTEWLEFTKKQRNTTPNSNGEEVFSFASAKTDQREIDKMQDVLKKAHNNLDVRISEDEPDMISTLMYLRSLKAISDLQWAAILTKNDNTISHLDDMKALMPDGMDFVNYADNKIKPNE